MKKSKQISHKGELFLMKYVIPFQLHVIGSLQEFPICFQLSVSKNKHTSMVTEGNTWIHWNVLIEHVSRDTYKGIIYTPLTYHIIPITSNIYRINFCPVKKFLFVWKQNSNDSLKAILGCLRSPGISATTRSYLKSKKDNSIQHMKWIHKKATDNRSLLFWQNNIQ